MKTVCCLALAMLMLSGCGPAKRRFTAETPEENSYGGTITAPEQPPFFPTPEAGPGRCYGRGTGGERQHLRETEEEPKENYFSDLAPTVNMEFSELVGDDGLRDYPRGYPRAGRYRILVDIAHQVTAVYGKDDAGEYRPERYMLCSTGADDCTPKGSFKMGAYRVRFSKFARDGRYGQYWSQIRKAIYFHTTLYTQKDAGAYQTSTYEELGSPASHGCIRLTVPDARWIWYNIAPGTVCEIRAGDPEDEDMKGIRERLRLAKPPEKRLDIISGEIPNTDNWRIEDVPLEVEFRQGSQENR